jgi:hypothetical protein
MTGAEKSFRAGGRWGDRARHLQGRIANFSRQGKSLFRFAFTLTDNSSAQAGVPYPARLIKEKPLPLSFLATEAGKISFSFLGSVSWYRKISEPDSSRGCVHPAKLSIIIKRNHD